MASGSTGGGAVSTGFAADWTAAAGAGSGVGAGAAATAGFCEGRATGGGVHCAGGVGRPPAGGGALTACAGGAGVGVGGADASCFRYCVATNAYALAGASISVQSPCVVTSFNASPRCK